VLNFTTGKVEITGFDLLFPIEMMISTTETLVMINSYTDSTYGSQGFIATINRLTGEMGAIGTKKENGLYSTTSYTLKCKPKQRMF
jgi:hypothetical protein